MPHTILGGPDKLGGKDTIWVDSLDEALTASVVLRKVGRRPDSLVSVLREFRSDWPAWVRFAATSRPDTDTKNQLRALDGPRIDVRDERNHGDIRVYVQRRLRRGFRLVEDSREAQRAHFLRLQVVRDMLDPVSRAGKASPPRRDSDGAGGGREGTFGSKGKGAHL